MDFRHASSGPAVDVDAEVHALQDKLRVRTAQIFRDLSPWQVSQLARHPARPYTLDYLRVICDEFQELAGDRAFANDQAIVGGLARQIVQVFQRRADHARARLGRTGQLFDLVVNVEEERVGQVAHLLKPALGAARLAVGDDHPAEQAQ